MLCLRKASANLGSLSGRRHLLTATTLKRVSTPRCTVVRHFRSVAEDANDDEPLSGIPPPLEGIRIVDLTRVLAGPTATMLLADLGADVIKIEEVSKGDDTRSWGPPHAPLLDSAPASSAHLPPESAYFLAANRNKRSITVNFKKPEGLEIVKQLIERADVLVENFVPGKLAEMGLGWKDCKKINPRLVYASISGRLLSSRIFSSAS